MLGNILGSVGAGVGGLIGSAAAAGDYRKQMRLYQEALKGLQNADVNVDGTAYDSIQSDPRLRGAQLSALAQLQAQGNQLGLGVEDRAALMEAQDSMAAQDRMNREAIAQNMALRTNGAGGAGSEYAAQLANAQGSAQRGALYGAQVAGNARSRALQAMQASGQMAGQVRGQDWGEASQKAQAKDSMNQFNANMTWNKAQGVAAGQQGVADQYALKAQRKQQLGSDIGRGVGAAAGFAVGGA